MNKITRLVIFASVALGGCSGNSIWHSWIRTDGQRMDDNPTLSQQYQYDVAECVTQANKIRFDINVVEIVPVVGMFTAGNRETAADGAMVRCMSGRGYLRVRTSEMEEKLAVARETTLERQKLEQGAEAQKAAARRAIR